MKSSIEPDHAFDFVCLRCGTCCRWTGHVLLENDDITMMASAMGLSEADFVEQYAWLASNRRQLSLANGPDGACVMLEGGNCRVYAARPRQCREFPHTWRVDGCPGITAGSGRSQ